MTDADVNVQDQKAAPGPRAGKRSARPYGRALSGLTTGLVLFIIVSRFTSQRPPRIRRWLTTRTRVRLLCRFAATDLLPHDPLFDLLDLALGQISQLERAIAHPDQPVHRQINIVQCPPDLTAAGCPSGEGKPC